MVSLYYHRDHIPHVLLQDLPDIPVISSCRPFSVLRCNPESIIRFEVSKSGTCFFYGLKSVENGFQMADALQ